ncbi:enoyl-CoA hydratase/isomerase family protein [Mycolicibacterium sp. P9-22]|uniref:enoyl-CoA hydratase/isomerase family protein n=1 Tax=Mycolicibacterium sp. P9-22 TaxID=2024613 RepID=UPI0011EF052C|nr:enoyl-CoA hydratase-related protein [Mycolicibacterium sp. P9-22]KAA0120619.1 enoyl-CoA hydratase [Mycolicibacterium sp. P9-22]
MSDLEYSVSAHVATITLNRPSRMNAFTLTMVDQWARALQAAEGDDDVRIVVVTGTGKAFCSGVDLDEFTGETRGPLQEKQLLTDRVHKVAHTLEAMGTPVIAAVNGVAVGAGMDMSLMCDLRFAAASARFSEGYVRVGLVPGDGGCYYLPRIVGTAAALRLLLTGEFIDAQEALRIGLVTDVFADDEFATRVQEFAASVARQAPVAVQMIKRAVRGAERHDLRTALDLISSHQAVVTSTQDSREAMAAFRERRTAIFEGR